MTPEIDTEGLEIRLLCEAIAERYGYDFREYAEASLRRRFRALVHKYGAGSLSQLQHSVLHEPDTFRRLLGDLTVPTSEMYRDPFFFKAFREQVLPVLRTYPALRFWHAGCSTGEEVYSLAIMLREEGLESRSLIYATDLSPAALAKAKDGIYPVSTLQQGTANYQQAGGREPFSKYFTAAYGFARLDPSLREIIVFAEHNLARDDVFSEVHVVFCRNVLIYFKRELQSRVVELFLRSLPFKGYLCLGTKEAVSILPEGAHFEAVDAAARIYRKIRRDQTVPPPRSLKP